MRKKSREIEIKKISCRKSGETFNQVVAGSIPARLTKAKRVGHAGARPTLFYENSQTEFFGA
jgi:hypothetical protein